MRKPIKSHAVEAASSIATKNLTALKLWRSRIESDDTTFICKRSQFLAIEAATEYLRNAKNVFAADEFMSDMIQKLNLRNSTS